MPELLKISLRSCPVHTMITSKKARRSHETAEPLNVGATEIGARRLGQVHILQTKSLTTKPPELGREPPPDPGVHRLKAAPSRRPRKKASPRIGLLQTVLRQGVPEWNDRFPSVEEMPNKRLQIKGKKALGKDPRTCGPEWEWNKIRKSFMRLYVLPQKLNARRTCEVTASRLRPNALALLRIGQRLAVERTYK